MSWINFDLKTFWRFSEWRPCLLWTQQCESVLHVSQNLRDVWVHWCLWQDVCTNTGWTLQCCNPTSLSSTIQIIARLSIAISDKHDGSPFIPIATFLRTGEWNCALEMSKSAMTNSSCGFLFFLVRHRPRKKKSESLNRWRRSGSHGRVRQVCPNLSDALLFPGFVLARGAHVRPSLLSLDFQLHCFFTHFTRKRCTCHIVVVHVIVIGHLCKTGFFSCQSKFKHQQTANSSQRLPQPTYHRNNNVGPAIQLGEIVVSLFTIREESPPPVDTRHHNRYHCKKNSAFKCKLQECWCTKKRPWETCQKHVSIIHNTCVLLTTSSLQIPTIKIGLSCCKCDHIFARWARSFKSHPVRRSNAIPVVKPNLWTKRAFPGFENTSAIWTDGCTPNCSKSFFTTSLSRQS